MSLEKITQEILSCKKCLLYKSRQEAVPGEGNKKAEILFVGEAPGADEDRIGRPFVGNAGQFLSEMMRSIGFSRDKVYITNIVKCRPPGNRDPLPSEIKACIPYLKEQIKIIKPKLIVLLGRHALEIFLPGKKISSAHGQAFKYKGQVYYPLYHPAAALHQPGLKGIIKDDFKKIPAVLKKIDQIKEEKKEEKKPKQSKLI